MKLLVAVAVSALVALPSQAAFIVVGTVGAGANAFPFYAGAGGPSTRYQQVYSSSLFGGPVTIDSVSFFHTLSGGDFRPGTYQFSLSTTAVAVNALNTSNFNSNVGPNQSLFTVTTLIGAAPTGQIMFSGIPFAYNPSAGNLLLDIAILGGSNPSSILSLDANYNFGATSSRAHNFGSGFESIGLVTRFDFNSAGAVATPLPATVVAGLLGAGLLGVPALLRRRLLA